MRLLWLCAKNSTPYWTFSSIVGIWQEISSLAQNRPSVDWNAADPGLQSGICRVSCRRGHILLQSYLIQSDPETIQSDPDHLCLRHGRRLGIPPAGGIPLPPAVSVRCRSGATWVCLRGRSPFIRPPRGQRVARGINSMLHGKSPADAELFSWSIGDSNP